MNQTSTDNIFNNFATEIVFIILFNQNMALRPQRVQH